MRCFFLWLTFLFAGACVQAQTIKVSAAGPVEVAQSFSWFADSSGQLKLQDVLRDNGRFRTGKPEPPASPSAVVYWLAFRVENNTGADGDWVLDFQNWSYVHAYVQEENRF